MPASSEESLLPIMETLESSVAKEVTASDLPECSRATSKQILMQRIQFLPAEKSYHSHQLESLRAKYTPLNASSREYSPPKPMAHYKSPQNIKMSGDDLPTPKVVLFPPENVKPEWQESLPVGAGLVNMGNTCFLNSTLQCLTYTAPLVNYLMGDDHSKTCKLAGFCMLCELHQHIKSCFKQAGRVEPRSIVDKLQVIAKHMHLGRQEDAQEFLRYVVDRMQEACLSDHKQLDYVSKQTTAVSQIFGGYLRSQVVCLKCKAKSNTYEMFMDISLDIENAPSVVKAFEKYTQPEKLDIDNAYNCTECRQKVTAEKKFTIHKAPNVLTIQLKRFDYFRHLAKVTRHVKFAEELDLQPFMSNKEESAVLYELYAVLVHSGYTCTSGHYYCYIKAPNSMWYCMNDQHVTQVNIGRVLNAEAYLLFYKRTKSKVPNNSVSSAIPTEEKPVTPSDEPSTEMGSPTEIQSSGESSETSNGNEADVKTNIPESKPEVSPVAKTPEQPLERSKPRLVIIIKHGAVCYNSAKEWMDANSDNLKDNENKSVPYTEQSDGEGSMLNESDTEDVIEKNETNSGNVSQMKQSKHQTDSPVVDRSLETTTSVPGCYAALDKMASWMAARKSRRMFSKNQCYTFPPANKPRHVKKVSSDTDSASDTNLPKLNASSKWNFWPSAAQRSPSVRSTSSTSSGDSTAGDRTSQARQQRAHIPKFKQFCWTAIRKKIEKPVANGGQLLGGKTPDLSAYDFHEEDSSTLISFSRVRPHIREVEPVRVEPEMSDWELPKRRHKKHKKKKHKKHKKHHKDGRTGHEIDIKDHGKAKWVKCDSCSEADQLDGERNEMASNKSEYSECIDNGCEHPDQLKDACQVDAIHDECNKSVDLGKRCGLWPSQSKVKRIKIET